MAEWPPLKRVSLAGSNPVTRTNLSRRGLPRMAEWPSSNLVILAGSIPVAATKKFLLTVGERMDTVYEVH